jgi:RNA polymerase-binding protein DksA
MPELTDKQMQTLKARMLERQKALVREVQEQRSRTAANGNEDTMGGVGDAGDESVLRMETDLHLQEAGRDMEELRDIDAAVQRIDAGEYGECEQCGAEIGLPRLQVQPTATRCIKCQAQYEKTYAQKNTPTM